ncbi:MAG: alkyl hydroperoxide reductase [Chloroflexota bacterium]
MGKLEAKYRNDLAIIGVQSPKYPAEAIAANLEKAVQRLRVEHPVVEDANHRIWDAYGVRAWPTLMFVSPTGEVLARHAGEASFEALDRAIGQMAEEYRAAAVLNSEPISLGVHEVSRPMTELSFPGKVLIAGDRLFIADSGHQRVLVCDTDGRAQHVIGSGRPGLRDGSFAEAQFHRPQGMALSSDTDILYVADAENHAIRAVELQTGEVRTVAGTGGQALRAQRFGPARSTDLSSPYDVALDGRALYIAMAGTHQIWRLNLDEEQIGVFAGTGHEGLRDGPAESAWFAQPMGLSLEGEILYVSCAETQALRSVDIAAGRVSTLVGEGLFDFGDRDGPAAPARLQHNEAVAAGPGALYIADTYNNKIKILSDAKVSVLAGSGEAGDLDGPGAGARLWEPAGVSLHEDSLYVADTNNHLIRLVELSSGHVRTLTVTVPPVGR